MLAKLTAKNQITLPRQALDAAGVPGAPAYFQVDVEEGKIILTPTQVGAADAVRRKLAELGITDVDTADAVAWARQPRKRASGKP